MFLATKLGMTVARLRAEISQLEYVRWGIYYGRKTQRRQLATATAKARAPARGRR